MVDAITHHRPTLVVWENVLGALSADADSDMEPCPVCVGDERESHLRALGRVVGDLAEIGYDAVWDRRCRIMSARAAIPFATRSASSGGRKIAISSVPAVA
jgi:site-specific DNA-cytosine methylase